MLAQQQNPHAVSYSLQQQQIDSKEINSEGEADVKTFSIRQYAFASRQKSLLQSWPFPEKYLRMCLDRGLRNVLPPFGLHNNNSVCESSHNGIPNLNDSCDQDYDDKNVRVLKFESPDHHPLELKKQNIINHSDSGFLSNEERSKAMMTSLQEEGTIPPPDCFKNSSQVLNCSSKPSGKLDRRRRRKGRCKKRSMADILAVAKHCTSEEIYRINQFSYTATGNIIEGYCHETAPLENYPKSTEGDDHEVANFDVNVTCTS
ncbi:uncharacterized protein LOC114718417 [Neltuma alba]|uniref:uncharacterized protein LOC114718417 n=1 Tax=Neltuma alba TaxID=207710 RepID=UPI0010A314E9|nr:uncharacterized protein LOC114718417 [Prosopis alba]